MKNQFQQIMRQAQEMQAKMEAAQAEVANIEVEGVSGGGLVKIKMNGKHQALSCAIDTSLIKPEDKEMLEDLVVAAINDGMKKVEEAASKKMGGVMEGIPLPPGLKLPF
jgi:nucleoid-associated protein EbfC